MNAHRTDPDLPGQAPDNGFDRKRNWTALALVNLTAMSVVIGLTAMAVSGAPRAASVAGESAHERAIRYWDVELQKDPFPDAHAEPEAPAGPDLRWLCQLAPCRDA